MSQPDIEFVETTHTYRVNGRVVPSVTAIIRDAGLSQDPAFFAPGSADRGKAVHKSVELLVRAKQEKKGADEIDQWMGGLHPVIRPYVEAYAKFVKESRFVPKESEVRVYEPDWNYCGRVDLIGAFGGRRTDKALVEIKSGSPHASHALQTAGYLHALRRNGMRRYALYLRKDGTYRLVQHESHDDMPVFLSAVRVTAFRRAHGLIEEEKQNGDNV